MEKCPITELPAEPVSPTGAANFYKIKFEDDYIFITLGISFNYFSKDEYFIENRYLLAGAILNNQMPEREDLKTFSLTEIDWKEKISKVIYPKTPKDKIDNLFKALCKLQKFDGEEVSIHKIVSNPGFWYKHFFKSSSECYYYIKVLDSLGLICGQFQEHTGLPVEFQLTFKGLNYYLEITESGKLSNKCFVAMSFDPKMKETREAIKTAILKNDYVPIIVDEQLIDSSQTINDAIISEIRSCKFCIADFSEQKDGVYFESGFAVGLGKPVIYTCQTDWFNKSHFDTNHFPHLIYSSHIDLIDKLDKKIKAWIK